MYVTSKDTKRPVYGDLSHVYPLQFHRFSLYLFLSTRVSRKLVVDIRGRDYCGRGRWLMAVCFVLLVGN